MIEALIFDKNHFFTTASLKIKKHKTLKVLSLIFKKVSMIKVNLIIVLIKSLINSIVK